MTRMLLIGARGFLGSHINRAALQLGIDVVTTSRFAGTGSGEHYLLNLASSDAAQITALMEAVEPDVIVNAAGATSGTPEDLAAVNTSGVHALATALVESESSSRLIHLGSAAEYGRSNWGSVTTESAPAGPVSPYGMSKLAGTLLVQLARSAGVDATVLRIFNPIGPGAPPTSLLGRVVRELKERSPGHRVHLGALDAVRDFVDIRDVAQAVVAASSAVVLPHPVLNIGSGKGVSARDLLKELIVASGSPVVLEEDAGGSERSSGVPWQRAGIARARHDLGWQPTRALSTSVADCWQEAQ